MIWPKISYFGKVLDQWLCFAFGNVLFLDEDCEEPGGASQGGPVHAAQVTKYDRHCARDGRDDDQHERGVHHVRRVLGVLGAEDEGGLDDEGDPGEHQAEGDHLENATSLLEEDAGEEGHTDWSDRGNHGHVCYGKIPETQNSTHM